MRVVLAVRALAIAGLVALGASGCAFNPYEQPIVPGIDDVKAAPDEIASDEDSSNLVLSVAILPANLAAAGDGAAGLDAALSASLSRAVNGAGSLKAIAGGAEATRLINQLKSQDNALYNQAGGAQVGRLAKADFVAWPTVTFITSSVNEIVVEENGQQVRKYFATAEARVKVTLLNVETGEYVIDAEDYATKTTLPDAIRPGPGLLRSLEHEAARNAMDDLQPIVGQRFPAFGYIVELRGERSVALVKLPGTSRLQIGTLIKVMRKRIKIDPRTNDTTTRYETIGNLRVELVDQNGIWCSTIDGEDFIRLGHPVQTAGREADSWFENFIDTIN